MFRFLNLIKNAGGPRGCPRARAAWWWSRRARSSHRPGLFLVISQVSIFKSQFFELQVSIFKSQFFQNQKLRLKVSFFSTKIFQKLRLKVSIFSTKKIETLKGFSLSMEIVFWDLKNKNIIYLEKYRKYFEKYKNIKYNLYRDF